MMNMPIQDGQNGLAKIKSRFIHTKYPLTKGMINVCPQSEGSYDAHSTWRRNHSQNTETNSTTITPPAIMAVLADTSTTVVAGELRIGGCAIVMLEIVLNERCGLHVGLRQTSK
jgi:hypothetical protein